MKGKDNGLAYFRRIGEGEESCFAYVKEEDVINFSLDQYGKDLPLMEGHFTMIQNYIIKYWQRFIKPEVGMLYITLRSYCYGDRDYCYPSVTSLAEISGVTRNTIAKRIKVLEDFGFIYRFFTHNKNEKSEDGTGSEESPIFKVRKMCPLLPSELIEKLPEKLAKEHKKFLEKITRNGEITMYQQPDFKDIFNNFIYENGKLNPVRESGEDRYILRKATIKKADHILWSKVLEELGTIDNLLPPAYHTYVESALLESYEGGFTLWVKDSHAFSYIYKNYEMQIVDILKRLTNQDRIKFSYDLYDEQPPEAL